jgi:hypothetical protein
MASFKDRLARLETSLTAADDPQPWAEVDAAQRRQTARVRLRLGRRLGLEASDPLMVEALTWLADDDPVRMAEDDGLIARWHHARGMTEHVRGARERLMQRLNEMARRLQA